MAVYGAGRVAADDPTTVAEHHPSYNSKHAVRRQYSEQERVRYQLWDYSWNPNPDAPITRIEVRIGEQKVYVYQEDYVAGRQPHDHRQGWPQYADRPLHRFAKGHRP